MAIVLKAGSRLRSAVDATEVVVVKVDPATVDLRCGGHAMVDISDHPSDQQLDPAWADGTSLGKRYGSDELGLEVLCTKAGEGSLSIGDEPLLTKASKPLPASD